MRVQNIKSKSVAVVLSLLMVATPPISFGSQAIPAPSLSPNLIPEDVGSVEESFAGQSGKTIIYIQDSHDSLEAQLNIAAMIDHLVENMNVRTVLEEGYEGVVPTDKYFNIIEDRSMRKNVSDLLLDELQIGGAEYAHINRTREFKLIGADSLELHAKNIKWYQEMAKHQRQVEQDISEIATHLKNLINTRFSEAAKKRIKQKEKLANHEMGLLEHLSSGYDVLVKAASREHVREVYPTISIIIAAHQEGEEEQLKSLKAHRLFEELKEFESEVMEHLLETEGNKKIYRHYQAVELLRKLNRLEVSSEEFYQTKGLLDEIDTLSIADFLAKETGRTIVLSEGWQENIKHAILFYETANARDQKVAESLREFEKVKGETTAVLVFGGFHKERIRNILRKNDHSYHIVTPRITEISEKHRLTYRRLMSGKASVEELLAQLAQFSRLKPIFVALENMEYQAAARALQMILRVRRESPSGGLNHVLRTLSQESESNVRTLAEVFARSEARDTLKKPIDDDDDKVARYETLQKLARAVRASLQAITIGTVAPFIVVSGSVAVTGCCVVPNPDVFNQVQLERHIQNVLLAGENISNIETLSTNSAERVAAQVTIGAGTSAEYVTLVYSTMRDAEGNPVELLNIRNEATQTPVQSVFDDTGNVLVVHTRDMTDTGQDAEVRIYDFAGENTGEVIFERPVPEAVDVEIIDQAGSELIVTYYPDFVAGGVRVVLDVSDARTEIISSNVNYLPPHILESLSRAISNSNFVFELLDFRQDVERYESSGTNVSLFTVDGEHVVTTAHDSIADDGSHFYETIAMDVSPNGQYWLMAGHRISVLSTGERRESYHINIITLSDDAPRIVRKPSFSAADPIRDARFSSNETYTVTFESGRVAIYDLISGEEIVPVTLSPDGRFGVSVRVDYYGDVSIRILDSETNNIAVIQINGEVSEIVFTNNRDIRVTLESGETEYYNVYGHEIAPYGISPSTTLTPADITDFPYDDLFYRTSINNPNIHYGNTLNEFSPGRDGGAVGELKFDYPITNFAAVGYQVRNGTIDFLDILNGQSWVFGIQTVDGPIRPDVTQLVLEIGHEVDGRVFKRSLDLEGRLAAHLGAELVYEVTQDDLRAAFSDRGIDLSQVKTIMLALWVEAGSDYEGEISERVRFNIIPDTPLISPDGLTRIDRLPNHLSINFLDVEEQHSYDLWRTGLVGVTYSDLHLTNNEILFETRGRDGRLRLARIGFDDRDRHYWSPTTVWLTLPGGFDAEYESISFPVENEPLVKVVAATGAEYLLRIGENGRVTVIYQTPDGGRLVNVENGQLVIRDDQNEIIGSVPVSGEQASLIRYHVTNDGVFYVINQRDNISLNFVSFNDIDNPYGIVLPEGIHPKSPLSIRFPFPGLPIFDITSTDRRTYRVFEETGAVAERSRSGEYLVAYDEESGSLVLQNARGVELMSYQVSTQQANLVDYNLTDDALYINLSQRGNAIFEVVDFNELDEIYTVELPMGVSPRSPEAIHYPFPGKPIADIESHDRNTYRVDLETLEILRVTDSEGNIRSEIRNLFTERFNPTRREFLNTIKNFALAATACAAGCDVGIPPIEGVIVLNNTYSIELERAGETIQRPGSSVQNIILINEVFDTRTPIAVTDYPSNFGISPNERYVLHTFYVPTGAQTPFASNQIDGPLLSGLKIYDIFTQETRTYELINPLTHQFDGEIVAYEFVSNSRVSLEVIRDNGQREYVLVDLEKVETIIQPSAILPEHINPLPTYSVLLPNGDEAVLPQIAPIEPLGSAVDLNVTERGARALYFTGVQAFSGITFTYDLFGTSAVEIVNLNDRESIQLGVLGSPEEVLVEVAAVNANGATVKDVVRLTGILPTTEQVYEIPLSSFEQIEDFIEVRSISVIVTGPSEQGVLEVNIDPLRDTIQEQIVQNEERRSELRKPLEIKATDLVASQAERGTLVVAAAELASLTDAQEEELHKVLSLWKRAKLIVFGAIDSNNESLAKRIERLTQYSGVVYEETFENVLEKYSKSDTLVEVSRDGREYQINAALIRNLKHVKLKKEVGNILFALILSINHGQLPETVEEGIYVRDAQSVYAQAIQAILSQRVVAYSA